MRMRLLLLIITAITIVSCNDARKSETYRLLEDVDSYIEARPDSALAVLEGIDVEDLGSREEKAKYALLMSMALDKNYIDRTDFEVLQPAIDYYEDHGSATDKLRTFYYQGRIYQNGGDDEMAMECFVRAVEEGDGAEDCMTMARAYYAQGTLYYKLYNHQGIVESCVNALKYYERAKSPNNQMRCLLRIVTASGHLGNKEDADTYLQKCDELLDQVSESVKGSYYATMLSYYINFSQKDKISKAIDNYITNIDASIIDWGSVAYGYTVIGQFENAYSAMKKYESSDDARYYSLWADIYKHQQDYKKALDAYETYIAISDSIDLAVKEVPFCYAVSDSLSICYLQFNMCYDSLNYPQLGQRFDDLVEEMMAEIEDKSIQTLVVDVRNNGGGNSGLCDLLLSYLTDYDKMKNMGCKVRMSELLLKHQPNLSGVELNDGTKPDFGDVFDYWEIKRDNPEEVASAHRINHDPGKIFKGNVIFISGRSTFSSAGLLLTLARDNNIGTIIGETSGHRPSHYGDVLRFNLPNTDTKATVSCRHFTRPNENLNNEIELVPDVVLNLSDYTMDKDPAWEWIIKNHTL